MVAAGITTRTEEEATRAALALIRINKGTIKAISRNRTNRIMETISASIREEDMGLDTFRKLFSDFP